MYNNIHCMNYSYYVVCARACNRQHNSCCCHSSDTITSILHAPLVSHHDLLSSLSWALRARSSWTYLTLYSSQYFFLLSPPTRCASFGYKIA